jgi:hypothetical protein
MTQNSEHNVTESVMKHIAEGKSAMRPKWHFVLQAVLLVVAIHVALMLALFVVSLIVHVIRDTGLLYVSMFGMRGMGAFLGALPWLLITLSIIFVVVLEILSRQYAFAYRRPLLVSLSVVLFAVIGGGAVLGEMGMHDGMRQYLGDAPGRMGGGLYQRYENRPHDFVYPGEVIVLTESSMTIRHKKEGEFVVIFTEDTRLPDGRDVAVGDRVVVFGNPLVSQATNTVEALGVKRLDMSRRAGKREPPLLRAIPSPYMDTHFATPTPAF